MCLLPEQAIRFFFQNALIPIQYNAILMKKTEETNKKKKPISHMCTNFPFINMKVMRNTVQIIYFVFIYNIYYLQQKKLRKNEK